MNRQFRIKVDGAEYSVEINGNTLIVNNTPFVIGTQDDMVTLDGIAYKVKVENRKAIVDGKEFVIEAGGFRVKSSETRKETVEKPKTHVSKASILSVMSGAIIKVLVKVGDKVEPNSVLMILEAMKMENEIIAERGGIIKKIHVKVGDKVEEGQPLLDIE
jgi:biotin carboxyl carrier protein